MSENRKKTKSDYKKVSREELIREIVNAEDARTEEEKETRKNAYNVYVSQVTPTYSLPLNMLKAFLVGGIICCIGQAITNFCISRGMDSLTFPVFFQALGYAVKSSMLTIIRTVFLFIPLAYLFSRFGLNYFWLTFPVTDSITTLAGYLFYRQFVKKLIPKADKEARCYA